MAFRSGLVRLEVHPQDAGRRLARFIRAANQFYAAPLTAAARVDLCLDDTEVGGQGLVGLNRLFYRSTDMPRGHAEAMLGEQLLRLIFVNFHAEISQPGPIPALGQGSYLAQGHPGNLASRKAGFMPTQTHKKSRGGVGSWPTPPRLLQSC